jgi:hypothetical protein
VATKEQREQYRFEALQGLSSGKQPRCACCGEKRLWALTIDHKEGGGNVDRAVTHNTVVLVRRALRASGEWPRHRFQVLCATCNHGKRIAGERGHCPHKHERRFMMHKKDRIIAGLSGAAAALSQLLVAFDVITLEQSTALVAVLVAFIAGYSTDRGAAKDALKK